MFLGPTSSMTPVVVVPRLRSHYALVLGTLDTERAETRSFESGTRLHNECCKCCKVGRLECSKRKRGGHGRRASEVTMGPCRCGNEGPSQWRRPSPSPGFPPMRGGARALYSGLMTPVSMDGTHEGSAPGRLPRRDPVYILVQPVNSGQAVFLCANLQTGLSAHCPPRLDRSAAIFFSSMSSISISCSLDKSGGSFLDHRPHQSPPIMINSTTPRCTPVSQNRRDRLKI